MTALLFHSTKRTKRKTKKMAVKPLDTRTGRVKFTDSIQMLVEHATFQRSKNSKMYFAAIGRLVKVTSGVSDRNLATAQEMALIDVLESSVRGEILRGVELGVYYKNIYQNIKVKLESIGQLLK